MRQPGIGLASSPVGRVLIQFIVTVSAFSIGYIAGGYSLGPSSWRIALHPAYAGQDYQARLQGLARSVEEKILKAEVCDRDLESWKTENARSLEILSSIRKAVDLPPEKGQDDPAGRQDLARAVEEMKLKAQASNRELKSCKTENAKPLESLSSIRKAVGLPPEEGQDDPAGRQDLAQIVEQMKRELDFCKSGGALSLGTRCSEPKITQRIPSLVVQASTDLYLRRVWGLPEQDLPEEPPKYLLAMAAHIRGKVHVDYMIRRFPAANFTVVLFHYDSSSLGEWAEFEWSNRTIHIQAQGQGKWWFAKRFLHPSVIAAYDYVFFWDDDLGLDNFHPLRFLDIMRRNSLEVAQPALFPYTQVHHNLTRLVNGSEVHKIDPSHPLVVGGNKSDCIEAKWPPCAGFVEGMAPVFSKKAWACVWHMIQNDLVNGWGIDLGFHVCANGPGHENMGIIDAEYVEHQSVFSVDGTDRIFQDTGKTFKVVVEERSAAEDELLRRRWYAGLAYDWSHPCPQADELG